FFQAEDGIRDGHVTGVQTCALPIWADVAADAHGRERVVAAARRGGVAAGGRGVASAQGLSPGQLRTLSRMGMFFHSAEAPPDRAADPAVRKANLRRIGPLFAPYKLRLSGVLLLIVVSAGLGVIPAFLLKHVLEAIGRN